MIRILYKDLPPAAQAGLDGYQARVDAKAPDFPAQVAEAKRLFGQANTKGNATFDSVKTTLAALCCGGRRCHYCEDSAADEVEHIRPKDWYPDQAFRWDNYCYACGPCNGPKSNRFAVFNAVGEAIRLTREHGLLPEPPPAGQMVLIHPRADDPLSFLFLDIQSKSFAFTEFNDEPDSTEHRRAAYTIEILGLNERSFLVQARREAYHGFRARLREYIAEREAGATNAELNVLAQNLCEAHHQTVWQEMKRQHQQIPELKALFDQVPEALNW